LVGGNDGTEQESFSMDELVEKFSIERVSRAGAKFDFEKAKWFNHEYIKRAESQKLKPEILAILKDKNISIADDDFLGKVIDMVKDRLTFLQDFWDQASFFFEEPKEYDLNAVKHKWNEDKTEFFKEVSNLYSKVDNQSATELEAIFKQLATDKNLKVGELMLPFRIMLVGGKFGPGVFDIAALLGKTETNNRIEKALAAFSS